METPKSLEIRLSDEGFVEEAFLSWYKSQEVNTSRQIISVFSSSSSLVSMKRSNTMAYRIHFNTPIFDGDGDPKKNCFMCEALCQANLIDDENQHVNQFIV